MSYEQYKVNIPEGIAGNWKVVKFTVSPRDAELSTVRSMFSFTDGGRSVPEGTYTGLYHGGTIVMSDTPSEIRDHLGAVYKAKGKCLVNGLGLGMVAAAMLSKPEVTHVTVIDISPEVIQLVGTTLKERYGDRLTIIQADAYTWQPPKGEVYDVAWHDIWNDLCEDNLPLMAKLHRKYGKRCGWQGSWGKELCLYHRQRDKRSNRGWY